VYSVPSAWAGLDVTAHVGADDVQVVGPTGTVVHPRMRLGQRSIDYRHYLSELARKPQALRQVAAELVRDLGTPFDTAGRLLVDRHGPKQAARIFAKVLGYVETRGLAVVAQTLQAALRREEPLLQVQTEEGPRLAVGPSERRRDLSMGGQEGSELKPCFGIASARPPYPPSVGSTNEDGRPSTSAPPPWPAWAPSIRRPWRQPCRRPPTASSSSRPPTCWPGPTARSPHRAHQRRGLRHRPLPGTRRPHPPRGRGKGLPPPPLRLPRQRRVRRRRRQEAGDVNGAGRSIRTAGEASGPRAKHPVPSPRGLPWGER
jgi:hypothetical protein